MELKQGDLENLIMNAMWDLQSEGCERVFVGDVQERIRSTQRKWAYTTVKTVMDRLVDKALATRHKDGKRYYYLPALCRRVAGEDALKKLVRQYFQGDVQQVLMAIARLQEQQVNWETGQPAVPDLAVPNGLVAAREAHREQEEPVASAAELSRAFHTHLLKRSYESRALRPAASRAAAHAALLDDDLPILIGASYSR